MRARSIPALVLAVLIALPAIAQQRVLRIGAQADAGTMDPHAQNIQTTITVQSWVYEALVTRDKQLRKAPGLAVSWQQASPTTWRFALRPGVKFHDGTALTAADVVFSVMRAKEASSQFSGLVSTVAEVRAVDDLTVEFTTTKPDPLLPDELAYIMIMSRAWAEANNVAKPQDLRQKAETFAVLHANGTGPFMLQSREPDSKTVLVRNKAYWGKTEGNVDQVVFQPVGNDSARVAALLAGSLDLLIDVPGQDVARLGQSPDVKLERVDEFRTIFFGFDLKNDALKYGEAKGNPFKDPRVRRAISLAMDRPAIVRTAMRGLASPTAQILAPGNVGYDAALDQAPAADRAAARKLLADAGYPEGFAFTLDCPNDRYINDEQVCRTVTSMLTGIGLKVNLNLMPRARYFPKIWERDTSMYMMGFNSPYFDGSYALQTMLMTRDDKAGEGIYNYSNIADPAMDQAIRAATGQTDPVARDAAMKEVYRQIAQQDLFVSLYNQVLVYAMRKNVHAPIRPDNWLDIRLVTMD